MTRAFLYDTWALVALANRRDPAHAVAATLDEELERRGFAAVTTDYIMDEAITLLHAAAGAKVSLAFVELMEARVLGNDIMLASIGDSRRARALDLFRRLAPEERRLSFTDTTSFAVMAELGLELAFTADRHFFRAGSGIRPLVEHKKGRYVPSSGWAAAFNA